MARCGHCQTDVEKAGRYWTVCGKMRVSGMQSLFSEGEQVQALRQGVHAVIGTQRPRSKAA